MGVLLNFSHGTNAAAAAAAAGGWEPSFISIDLKRLGVSVTFFVFPERIKSSKSVLIGVVGVECALFVKLSEIELRFSLKNWKRRPLLIELDLESGLS
jgi:hypothetical protein